MATDGIEARGVRRRFGPLVAVDGVDLHVPPGRTVAVVGPSGAGKSTLLRILATLVTPDEGTASVAGHDVVRAGGRARRALGVVMGDEHSWYWRLSGRRNLEFFAALGGLPRAAARERADEAMRTVGLAATAVDRPVGEWSSGMKARLALARGILLEPAALLLDEPTRSLDVGSAELLGAVVDAERDRGAAVLVVTHDPHEAAALADDVLVMAGGRLTPTGGTGRGDAAARAARIAALVREAGAR